MSKYIKLYDKPNLLHLYEHVACINLHNILRSRGYFCYVDYSIKGLTYDTGYCTINIETYVDKLKDFINIDLLNTLNIHEQDIHSAFLQMIAEEETTFFLKNKFDYLDKELSSIHSISWSSPITPPNNTIEIEDSTLERDGYLDTYEYITRFKLSLPPTINEDIRYNLGCLVGHNIQVHTSNLNGYYRESMDIDGDYIKLSYKVTDLNTRNQLKKDMNTAKDIANDLIDNNSIDRLFNKNFDDIDVNIVGDCLQESIQNWSIDNFEFNSSKSKSTI